LGENQTDKCGATVLEFLQLTGVVPLCGRWCSNYPLLIGRKLPAGALWWPQGFGGTPMDNHDLVEQDSPFRSEDIKCYFDDNTSFTFTFVSILA
jgi:hypothetical protein